MIYLASPYSHPDERVRQHRFEAACQATAALMRAGLIVFSPIAHSHPLTRYGLPGDWQFWERSNRAHLEACSVLAILALEGWEESKGVNAEIHIAAELRLPVFLLDPAKVGVRTESAPAAATGAQEGM